ncbi:hypothetical protein BDW02DRAFT_597783 [Decorospora gaudefroyi]|uniref:Uncharacterized protein n=1 Tax=Decorospora gaudefroyi TaxID=184978 RepID=A0A6A5KGJ5_9PLEO|nr:hypothetical protein BDW02DRAFT_597783 [Decorospora gaudefroyi]
MGNSPSKPNKCRHYFDMWCIIWQTHCLPWCQNTLSAADGTSVPSNEEIRVIEDFKKCIVNDGSWYPRKDACSIDTSKFSPVSVDDSKLDIAIEPYISSTALLYLNDTDVDIFAKNQDELPVAYNSTLSPRSIEQSTTPGDGIMYKTCSETGARSEHITFLEGMLLGAVTISLCLAAARWCGQHRQKRQLVAMLDNYVHIDKAKEQT